MTKRGALGRWWHRGDARAAKQQGDVHALDREGDPRGGIQSEAYRLADPRDASARPGLRAGTGGVFSHARWTRLPCSAACSASCAGSGAEE